jgi:hypothetical protein
VCVLDPDGDVVRHLKRTGAGRTREGWACYYTDLDGVGEVGIIGRAVGAAFAVLVTEQLFASGCRLLVSVTGRLRARRRFGYWGEQIGHLRGRHLRSQSGHHFGARRQNSMKVASEPT